MMGEKMLSLAQGDRGMEAGIFFVGLKNCDAKRAR